MKRICFAVIALLLLLQAGCVEKNGTVQRLTTVRPIEITVIDADSKKPLEGIPVDYAIGCDLYEVFLIPALAQLVQTFPKYPQSKLTDASGHVLFHVKRPRVRRHEWILSETVFVNLDIDPDNEWVKWHYKSAEDAYKEHYWRSPSPAEARMYAMRPFLNDEGSGYFNPRKKYSGVFLHTTHMDSEGLKKYGIHMEGDFWDKPKEFDGYIIRGSMNREKESIVIELRRKNSPVPKSVVHHGEQPVTGRE